MDTIIIIVWASSLDSCGPVESLSLPFNQTDSSPYLLSNCTHTHTHTLNVTVHSLGLSLPSPLSASLSLSLSSHTHTGKKKALSKELNIPDESGAG